MEGLRPTYLTYLLALGSIFIKMIDRFATVTLKVPPELQTMPKR